MRYSLPAVNEAILPDFDEHLRPTWEGPGDDESTHGPRNAPRGAGAELVRIHDHLRREAAELRAAVNGFIEGREDLGVARSVIQQLAARQGYSGIGSLCSGFCALLTLHHTIEDRQVFPGLGRVEPALVPVLRRLMEEHEVIAAIIALGHAEIDRTEADRGAAAALKKVVEHLCDRLGSHLRYEESQLVGPLDRYGFS